MTDTIETIFIVMVVVQRDNQFLLVHEAKEDQGWFLPAGRVEKGETFEMAAIRETLEEGGIPINIEGILRIEHTPLPDYSRMRVIYHATPADDTPPKSIPDEESLEAAWVTLEDAKKLPLRAYEVIQILEYVSRGAFIYPTRLITYENAPF